MSINVYDNFTRMGTGALPDTISPDRKTIINHFFNILNGNANLYITSEDAEDLDAAKDIALSKQREVSKDCWVINGYVEYDKCETIDTETWVIPTYLSNRGKNALNALSNGYLWNTYTHTIDIPNTDKYYRTYFQSEPFWLPFYMAEKIKSFKEPELQPLISDMIVFILGASLIDGKWIPVYKT